MERVRDFEDASSEILRLENRIDYLENRIDELENDYETLKNVVITLGGKFPPELKITVK